MTANTPAEFNEVKKEAIERVHFYFALAEKKLGIRVPVPNIVFDIKGRVAGYACYGKNLIRFNPTLLRENIDDFLKQTTGHEAAHFIARAKDPACDPHGKVWGSVMWTFGLPATRCHSYDTARVPTQLGKGRILVPQGNGRIIRGNSLVKVTNLNQD